MVVRQVTDEVLYTGLIEMQELDLPEGLDPRGCKEHYKGETFATILVVILPPIQT